MANPVWCVASVQPRPDYTMLLTFENGEKRIYDARPLLKKPICRKLNDLPFFMKARAAFGTVVWSGDVDIAPEHLYECSKPVKAAETSEEA